MGLNSGDMDREVTIQRRTESTGASGFPVETWGALASAIWMQRLDVRGQERFDANQITAPQVTTWRMFFREDMDPETVDVAKDRRLLFQGRFYDITAGVRIDDRTGIELTTVRSNVAS